MKHTLGKRLTLFCLSILFMLTLNAEDFTYTLQVDKKSPYVKEAVLLTLDINQTNQDVVLLFDFDLLPSEFYTFQRVDLKEIRDEKGLHIRYNYLIYPLKAKEVAIAFRLIKKVTSEDSVAYSFSGDRDNVKGLVTKDYTIDLAPLVLQVKSLPQGTQLVGDFTLDTVLKKHHAKVYEPIPFHIKIQGKGYPPLLEHLLPSDINFTLFQEKPKVNTFSNIKGTQSTVRYTMALSHDTHFTLPAISIKAFNPDNNKKYTLSIPSERFNILEPNITTLVDKTDTPPVLTQDWGWLKHIFSYLFVFFCGYLTAKVFTWTKRPKKEQNIHPLKEKIDAAKSEKELLQILMAADNRDFDTCITLLEDSLYANGKMKFRKIKEKVLHLL